MPKMSIQPTVSISRYFHTSTAQFYTSRPTARGPAAGRPGGRPPRCQTTGPQGPARKYFYKSFCTKIPAARQRGDQVPAARQRGGRGIFL